MKSKRKDNTELKETRAKLQADIRTLTKGKLELENAALNAETYYAQIISNAAVMMSHLGSLEKTAGAFNKQTQRMNLGYLLLQAIGTEVNIRKEGDPTEISRVSIWTGEQNKFIRDFLYQDVIVKLKTGE